MKEYIYEVVLLPHPAQASRSVSQLGTTDILGQIIFIVRACSVHCRMQVKQYPWALLDAINNHTVWQPKIFPYVDKCLMGRGGAQCEIAYSWKRLL